MVPVAYRTTATVQTEGKLEITIPGLLVGETVEIVVLPIGQDWDGCDAADSFIGRPRGAVSRFRVDEIILHEREAWEG